MNAPLVIVDIGSAGKTRTYNPSVTLCLELSFKRGLSHQLCKKTTKLPDARGSFIGQVSSTPSLCTFLLTIKTFSAGFAQDCLSDFCRFRFP